MMTTYSTYPAVDLLYGTTGAPVDPAPETGFIAWLAGAGSATTDVIFISHGWNNDMAEAHTLYQDFFSRLSDVQTSQNIALDRNFAVAAIYWPSKRFAEPGEISGGAAAIAPAPAEQLNAQLDQLKVILAGQPDAAAKIEQARAQIGSLNQSEAAQDAFVAALASAMPGPREDRDEGLDEAMEALQSGESAGRDVLARLNAPIAPVLPLPDENEGGALGLGDIIGDITGAATQLANYFTYYTMKDRAGIVGRTGVIASLLHIHAAHPALRLHLVGHSFGGRVVSAAANAVTTPKLLDSMLLLEAAYSHNGLAKNWDNQNSNGAFRGLVTLPAVRGEILITHSVHDSAVGRLYPLASRILNQVASALGDANDKFGGMGRNGAQHTPEAFNDTLLGVGEPYAPPAAGLTIRNLNGDGPPPAPTIQSHGDVAKTEIAWAWLSTLKPPA